MGEEDNLKKVADFFDVRVSVWSPELLHPELRLQEETALCFGDPDAVSRLNMICWTRNQHGLHVDVLLLKDSTDIIDLACTPSLPASTQEDTEKANPPGAYACASATTGDVHAEDRDIFAPVPDDCGGHSPISSDDVHREGSTSFDTQEQKKTHLAVCCAKKAALCRACGIQHRHSTKM